MTDEAPISKEEAIALSQTAFGWCDEEKSNRIYDLVLECAEQFGDKIITVECGVFGGKSLFPFAFAHKSIKNGYAFGIDTWDNITPLEGTNSPLNDKYWREVDMDLVWGNFVKNAADFKLRGYCRWIQERTDFAARLFPDNSISILHQDSGHNTETILEELRLWVPKLRKGARLIADDVSWVEARDGYSKLPDFGLELVEDYKSWQIWKKVR